MARDTQHLLQPQTGHDGVSRQLAILASKRAIRSALEPALKQRFDDLLQADPSSASTTTNDHRAAVAASDEYRFWASATAASQQRMWQVLAEQIDTDYARIAQTATQTKAAGGALSLSAAQVPSYQQQHCIHGQPGGYMLERDANDLAAGIMYEAGGNIYALGQGIGQSDSKGQRLIQHIHQAFPDFQPQRILELGCAAGGQSCDYPQAFPTAQCHAVDLSPAMLRYAHARAESLGVALQFHQMDAAATDFPDQYFDLIISHNLFHETAASHMPGVLAECFRLLRPSGICLHQDVPIQASRLDPYQKFLSDWQQENNDEPFWLDFSNADLIGLATDAGFAPDSVDEQYLQAIAGPVPWYVLTAVKAGA